MDSNAIIDYLGNKLPEKNGLFIDSIFPQVSVISRIEILGWYNATAEQIKRLKSYLNEITVFQLSEVIILKTIELRQEYKIKTPDAIIAATALVKDLILISRNLTDYKNIIGLKIMNPYNI